MQESNQLTLFVEDTLASHLVAPGTDLAKRMTATSGRRCIELYARSSPASWFVKTLLGMSVWDSTMCLLTWTTRVTPHKRLLFRLRASVPYTKGSEFLSWPTPTATDCVDRQPGNPFMTRNGTIKHRSKDGGQSFMRLSQVAKLLPTPTASHSHRGDCPSERRRQTPCLESAVKMWPTPTACGNNNRKGVSAKSGDGLATAVRQMIPTPTANDAKNATLPPACANRDSVAGYVLRELYATPQARDYRTGQSERWHDPDRSCNLNDQVGGSLNPDWVEWLMGVPQGWTDPDAQGTLPEPIDGSMWDVEPDIPRLSKGTPHRVNRLKALGNAVVPQQAYPIFAAIMEVNNANRKYAIRRTR